MPRMLFDFTDGVNNFLASNRIGDKEVSVGSNVWADDGAIRARGAIVQNGQATISINSSNVNLSFFYQGNATISLNGTVYSFHMPHQGFVPLGGGLNKVLVNGQFPVYIQLSTLSSNTAFSFIPVTTAGAAQATLNSTAVVGTGTNWTAAVKTGDIFVLDPDIPTSGGYVVSSVADDTHLTLASNYVGANGGANNSYHIIPDFNYGNSAVYPPSFETMLNKVYMATGGRALASWDGTTFANVTGAPQAHFLLNFKNYMFAANTAANPSRLFWSTVLNPDSWPASNFIDVAPNDGQQITGLFNDGTSLIVLKNRSLYKLSGDIFDPTNPTYTLTKMYTPPECVFDSKNSWAMWNGVYLLYGGAALYTYDGSNFITRLAISDKIQATLTSNTFAPASFSGLEASGNGQQAFTYNGNYWLTSSEITLGKTIVVLDRNQKWWIFDLTGSSLSLYGFFLTAPNTFTVNYLWCYYRYSGATPAYGIATLDQPFTSESVNASFTTKNYEFGMQNVFKKAYLLYKGQSSGTITFSYSIDGGTFTDVTVTMASGATQKSFPVVIGQIGKSIQFKVAHNSASDDFEVYGIELERNDLKQ